MIPYLDTGFLLTLLIHTSGSVTARNVLRECDLPFTISLLHQLQVENLFRQLEQSGHPGRQRAAATGVRLWAWYFTEGFFNFVEIDWAASFRLAVTWNSSFDVAPPPPLLLLHPALAVVAEATHFLSFEPRSRAVAHRVGLKLLPASI